MLLWNARGLPSAKTLLGKVSGRPVGCYLGTWAVGRHWPLWEPTSQGSPHLHTQVQGGSRLTFSWPFSCISFSSSTFPGVTYRIFLLLLHWLPCHFSLAVIEQQQHIPTRLTSTADGKAVLVSRTLRAISIPTMQAHVHLASCEITLIIYTKM